MNVLARITDLARVEMTDDGGLVLPKTIRDRVGLKAGLVSVGVNERGEAVLLPDDAESSRTAEYRRARVAAAIDELAGKYPGEGTTDAYMREIRGDYAP